MSDLKAAAQQALEALAVATNCLDGYYIPRGKTTLPEIEDAIAALEAALAEPVQEPGFWGRVAARQASRIKQLEATAQQALEALENCGGLTKDDAVQRVAAIIALKDVLEEPVQVPAKFLDVVTYTGTGVNCAAQALPAPDRSICPACGGMASDPIVPQRLRQRRNKSTT